MSLYSFVPYATTFLLGCAFACCVSYVSRMRGATSSDESQRPTQSAASTKRHVMSAIKNVALFAGVGMSGFAISLAMLQHLDTSTKPPSPSSQTTLNTRRASHQMAADKSLQNLTVAASPTLLLPAQSGLISISQLTDIRWPIPARSVQSEGIAQTSIEQLRAVVKGVDDTGSLGAVEIMMWPKAEQKNQKPAHILAEVQRKLQNSGYLYSETVKQGDAKNRTSVREFVAVNTRKKQVVCGFWMLTDQFVLLSWGEMKTPKALP